MSSCKIYVGNLAWATDENALGSHFNSIGPVKEAVVMRSDGRSRGFGFVTFTTAEEAERAIATMNDTELHGRRLRVNVANQQVRTGGAGVGDNYSAGGPNPGYGHQPGGFPDGSHHPYQAGPYGGYQPPHASQHGAGFMYGMNPSMTYHGNTPSGYEGRPSSGTGPDAQKIGGPNGAFYPVPAPYGYPPASYGQPPY